MKPIPPPPSDQGALFEAHQRLLDEAVNWFNSAKPPIRTIGDRMIVALTSHVIQLGSAIQRLCETGHAGEAPQLGRTMLSAGIILTYIAEDRDGRSIAYIQEASRVRGAWIATVESAAQAASKAGKAFFTSEAERQSNIKENERITALEEERLAAFAKKGIVPTKAGPNQKTWDGFNNEWERFEKMNGERWYLTFYKKFSDEIHVGASALAGILAETYTGEASLGAKFEDPLYVLKVSAEVVLNAISEVDEALSLKQAAAIKAMDSRFAGALSTFAKKTGR